MIRSILAAALLLTISARTFAAYGPSGMPVFANNSTGIVTYGSAVSVGDLEIVGGLIYPESMLVTPTATDSLGNACTLYSNQFNGALGGGAAWFYCPVTHAGTPAVTIAASGATQYESQLSDFTGFTGTPVAVMADNISANNVSASISTGSFNSTDANELMIGVTWANDNAFITLPSGWTLNNADTAYTNSFYETAASSGTATSLSGTLTGPSGWFAAIQGFVGSGGSSFVQRPVRSNGHPLFSNGHPLISYAAATPYSGPGGFFFSPSN